MRWQSGQDAGLRPNSSVRRRNGRSKLDVLFAASKADASRRDRPSGNRGELRTSPTHRQIRRRSSKSFRHPERLARAATPQHLAGRAPGRIRTHDPLVRSQNTDLPIPVKQSPTVACHRLPRLTQSHSCHNQSHHDTNIPQSENRAQFATLRSREKPHERTSVIKKGLANCPNQSIAPFSWRLHRPTTKPHRPSSLIGDRHSATRSRQPHWAPDGRGLHLA